MFVATFIYYDFYFVMQSKNHVLINGTTSTPEDDKDLSITSVLMNNLIDPPLQNGTLGKADIVTVNGNGVVKHPSSSSEDFDNDVSPGALYSDSRGSVGSFNTLEGKSLSSINEAWCDTNNNSTSDISELSISDSLLGSDAILLSNTPATSSVANDNVMEHPAVSTLTNGTIKQRSKSESPSSSLKRNRKMSAPTIDTTVSMEIPNIEYDDDDDEVTEDFSLRRSKYTPIRRKRISLAGSCPSLEIKDLGLAPQLLGRLEESGEADGSMKSLPGPLRKPTKQLHQRSPMSATPHTQTIVHDRSADEVDRPQGKHVAVKQKSDLVATKPPLPISKSDSSGAVKQRKKSVKGLLFPKKMSRKLSSSPVEAIVEQPAKDDATKPKVKKATRRAPLGRIISRLSPKRDIPSKDDEKHDGNQKEETKHKQPRKLSMAKSNSQSGGSLVSKTSSSSSIRSTETFPGQRSSGFTVSKEPLKSSPSETSFASREASISIESLLSDGSTDILMADSNYDLFCSSLHEDLLDDSASSSHHQHTASGPLPSDLHQPLEDTPLNLEDITLFTGEDDTGPAPAILVTSPVKSQNKKLVAVKDTPDVVRVHEVDNRLYRAKSMEVLSNSKLLTDVEVFTSNMPSSNLPSTVSVSTESLSSSPSKRKGGIIISTVKKCASLDLLAASKKQAPTTTITVSSKRTPTKAKPTPLTSSIHKAEEKKKGLQEKATSLQVREKGTVKSAAVGKSQLSPASSPAMTRQGSGRKLSSGSSSPFMRTSSRSSTGRKKSTTVTPESKLNISARSNSPAKKTTIVIKSSRVNTTPAKVTVISTPTSTKLTDHGNAQRVVSPAKSSMRRPSMQRVPSGRKKSTEKVTVKSPVAQSPSPQQRKIPFVSLFPAGDARRISRVSSDEVPVNNASKNDVVHSRSSSEVVSNTMLGLGSGLSDIVEDKMLITSSVETLASDRVASSMSDTTSLQKTAPTDTPVRRISSGPISNKTSSHTSLESQAPVRKKSVTGQPRPQSARATNHSTTGQHHSTIGQHHSDSALRRPGSAATRRTSSTMKPSVSGTMPRQLTKTKSDSKIGFSTLPRTRRVSETVVSPEMAASKRPVRPHSAAVSRGGSQATARSSARRISIAPTSSAGRINRSSATRRSKSTVTIPDLSQVKQNEESKTDEDDGAKMSTPAGSLPKEVKPKALDINRKNSTALRSSLRRTSTANKPTDTKDPRQSPARSSRRSIHHSVAAKATSVAAVSHVVTPNRKASMAGRTNSGSTFSTPKLDTSVSMSDLDSVKSADKYVHCCMATSCVIMLPPCVITSSHVSLRYPVCHYVISCVIMLPHVSLCYPMCHYVTPCVIMLPHVPLCYPMCHYVTHVLLCYPMCHYVTPCVIMLPHVSP